MNSATALNCQCDLSPASTAAPPGAVEDVDWRAYQATKGLSEKQQKVADKVRKREARVTHLQREIEKIKVCAGRLWWAKARVVVVIDRSAGRALLDKVRSDVAQGQGWRSTHARKRAPHLLPWILCDAPRTFLPAAAFASVRFPYDTLQPTRVLHHLFVQAKEKEMEELSAGQASVLVR